MAAIGKIAAIGEEGHGSRQLQLSDLPDEILIHILSLLPTESAVWTCLLLLRRSGQHHFWKSLTRLEFDAKTTMFSLKSNFINFVDRVMYLRDHFVPLVSFSLLHCMEEDGDNEYNLMTWITKAVRCNVEEFTLESLSYMEEGTPCLPSCLFRCQSLVKLDLEDIIFDVPSSAVRLPRLKYLRLSNVVLTGDNSTKKLVSSPLLQELVIDYCPWMFAGSISVRCPKLQILKIINDDDKYGFCAKIRIIGDNLKYFSYMGTLTNEYRICASSSTQLSKVEIYVDKEMPKKYALNCYNILKGISGTRNLALSDYFLKGLQKSSELLDTIPVFEDLTRLHIRVYKRMHCIDSLGLMKIYERCPHLEYLNIGKPSLGSRQLSPIPLCFRTHLKKILVHYYVAGYKKADAAIDVLLNNAFVLEELIIYCKRDEGEGFHEGGRKIQELQDRLNGRPRVSKDCIISVRVTDYIDCSEASYWQKLGYYDNCYLKSMNEFL